MAKQKYTPDFCEPLIEHMAAGLSFQSFAGVIKVNDETMRRWLFKHPEWAEAKQTGHAACLLYWEQMGLDGALGKIKGFQPASWIFSMKNRFQWRDRSDLTIGEDFEAKTRDHEILKAVPREQLLALVKKKEA